MVKESCDAVHLPAVGDKIMTQHGDILCPIHLGGLSPSWSKQQRYSPEIRALSRRRTVRPSFEAEEPAQKTRQKARGWTIEVVDTIDGKLSPLVVERERTTERTRSAVRNERTRRGPGFSTKVRLENGR